MSGFFGKIVSLQIIQLKNTFLMDFKKLNCISGWVVFALATIVYLLTLEPTASWWDCGEYIATAHKLQVGHPPGAPLFQMIGRFFSLFAFGNVTKVALMVNIMSALCSSFTILFLFWSITLLAKKIWNVDGDCNKGNRIAVIGAGIVGAMAYTFTESFWFSAVEGEVYAMSSMFTAITFWAILKWEENASASNSYRWILFIAYLIGLSIGVHLLNLLCIPAIVYVVYFKKYKTTVKGFILAGVLSVVLLAFVQMLLIPQIVALAGSVELFFVNSLGLPFHSGTIFYFAVLIALIIWGLYYTHRHKKVILNVCILSLMFIIIGYSSFFMLIIRANAGTPINENEPKDAISMLSYLNRDQYGSWPLLYGPYYMAKIIDAEDESPIYIRDSKKGRYVITDPRISTKPVYDENMMTVFPRMWNGSKSTFTSVYGRYIDKKNMVYVDERQSNGTTKRVARPTFGQNLAFFLDYQCGWMYWRYFMWNFVGRQNDIQGQGEIEHGNWLSGINFLDEIRLGDQKNLPTSMKNPSRTNYYFLPLILGLIGLFFHLKRQIKDTWIVFLLFFMTGLAIVVYLNQTPYQPRERDYSYAGSFYAFAIWIGLGVMSVAEMLSKSLKNKNVCSYIAVVACLSVPAVMGAQGWEGHNRSGKTAARDWGRNYLLNLPENAVIVTRGDNDTFPLWYVQEVEGFRTDVRVCNYMLASGYWYVHQMQRKTYESDPLPLSLSHAQYEQGVNERVYVEDIFHDTIELKKAMDFVKSEDPRTKVKLQTGEYINVLPAKTLKITIDEKAKDAMVQNGIVPAERRNEIVNQIVWTIKSNELYKNDLMLLDFFANNDWKRAVYFTSLSDIQDVLGIDRYMHQEGLAHRFMPIVAKDGYYAGYGGINVEESYDLLVNKVQWGGLNKTNVSVDPESSRSVQFVRQTAYMRLAKVLAEKKDFERAVNVLDKCIEFFPNEKIPFDYYMLQYPDIYYICGAMDKGDNVVKIIAQTATENIEYYGSLSKKLQVYYVEDLRDSMAMLNHLADVTRRYGRTDISATLKKKVDDYWDQFQLLFNEAL